MYILISKASILTFFVFQNFPHSNFGQVDQALDFANVRKEWGKKLASLWPSHCDEIKDILLTLFSSL